MKSLHGTPAGAAMLLETTDKKILIVKANYRAHWTLPGGVIDKGESPLHAAIRETEEEVGLNIEPDQVEFAGIEYRHSEEVDLYRFNFRATITDDQVKSIVLQATELESYALESADQIKEGKKAYSSNITAWANEKVFPVYSEQLMSNH